MNENEFMHGTTEKSMMTAFVRKDIKMSIELLWGFVCIQYRIVKVLYYYRGKKGGTVVT